MASEATTRQSAAPDPAERRATILHAAARCLADIGYDRVRLIDVSRQSGVSVGLIQHYFETRDALLREAFDLVSEELIARAGGFGSDAHEDPWQRIVALVDSLADDPDLPRHCVTWTQYCVVASREPELREGVQRIYAAWRRHLGAAIREGVESGRFRPVMEVDDVLDLLLAQIDGFELSVAGGYDRMNAEHLRGLVLRSAGLMLGVEA
jgi:AcrR family transcriptional regulator